MVLHKSLGAGFLESLYHESLGKEFEIQKVNFDSKRKLQVYYNEVVLKKYFIADFICFDKILLEINATSFLHKDN